MTRRTNCDENLMEIKKGPWTRDEDQKLLAYVQEHGHGSWRALPAKAGLQRCGKSCRLRWTNYLSPHIKRGKFSAQEDVTITRLHALLGNRWSSIATHLPKRTDNEVKNYWNTRLKKRLTRMGIDPATHKPKNNPDVSGNSKQAANISHMAQWETARLEAEVRLVREAKIVSNLQLHRRAAAPSPPSPLKLLNTRYLDVLKVWQATTTDNDFFGSPGSLESPTSILNFSCSSSNTVPTVGDHGISFMGNDSTSNGACGIMRNENISERQVKGNLENSLQLENNNTVNVVNCDSDMSCLMDLITPVNSNYHTYNLDTVGAIVGDSWNELLNLVTSSPTKSRVVLN